MSGRNDSHSHTLGRVTDGFANHKKSSRLAAATNIDSHRRQNKIDVRTNYPLSILLGIDLSQGNASQRADRACSPRLQHQRIGFVTWIIVAPRRIP